MNFDKPLYITNPTVSGVVDTKQKAMSFRVGAILDVLVVKQQDASSYTLKMGRHQMNATSETPLQVGKRALLQVLGTDAQGRAALRPLTEQQSQVAVLLQQRVAAQQASPIRQLVQTPANSQMRQTLEPLLALLPQRGDVLQAGTLRQTLQRSGVFLEALLARGRLPAAPDLKSSILRLLGQLQPSPTEGARPPPSPVLSNATPQANSTNAGAPQPQTSAPTPGQNAQPSTYAPPARLPTPQSPPAPSAPPPQTKASPTLPGNLLSGASLPPTTARAAASPPLPAHPQGLPASREAQISSAYQQTASSTANQHGLQLGKALAGMESKLESLPQLVRALESGVARIESQQLASLQAREQGQVQWLLDLPVRNGQEIDYWQLFMRREQSAQSDQNEKEKRWLVTLSVELDLAGKLAIHIDHSERRTFVKLFSEEAFVLQWVEEKSPILQAKLSKAGITNSEVEGHFGALPDSLQPDVALPGVNATA
ncbi:hypothetical protein [Litorivivens sp.]|uniref:hypothetical protein n=1 Tax=Litorivivens sp. TaxID=2020868 RepID=UPI003564BD80